MWRLLEQEQETRVFAAPTKTHTCLTSSGDAGAITVVTETIFFTSIAQFSIDTMYLLGNVLVDNENNTTRV